MPDYTRLKHNSDFVRVYRHGSFLAGKYLILHCCRCKNGMTAAGVRVGFATVRKHKGAVLRNRKRRVMREIFRKLPVEYCEGYDIIFTAKWLNEPKAEDIASEMLHLSQKFKILA